MTPEQIARVCHEANRAYSATVPQWFQLERWDSLPPEHKAGIVAGVQFCLDNPDADPAAQHARWLAYKEAHGWTWGPAKDTAKKQHPCMVPFHDLPEEQRVKDRLFQAIVRALA